MNDTNDARPLATVVDGCDPNHVYLVVSGKRMSVVSLLKMEVAATTVDARGCTGLTTLDLPAATRVYAGGCTGLTTLDLPAATTVDAGGCTGLTTLDLPAATTVDAGGCTGLTTLDLPAATTVYAGGCTGLTTLDLPAATWVYAGGCTGLTTLDLPAATTVDAGGCTGLTTLDLPAATTVYAGGCTGLTTLDLPAATWVYAGGCTGLTTLDLPAATTVDAGGCTGLTTLDLPAATTVDAGGCTGLTTLDLPAATWVYAGGCTGLTNAVFAGSDIRGYGFIGLRLRGEWRVLAGCRNFSPEEAMRHWKQNPECLALAESVHRRLSKSGLRSRGSGAVNDITSSTSGRERRDVGRQRGVPRRASRGRRENSPRNPPPCCGPSPMSPSNLRESAVSGDLYMALAMAQAQFTNPARNKTAIVRSKKGDNSSYQFKYASFDQIVEMARPALAGAGLALIQPITTVDKQPALVTKIAHGKSGQWLETVLPLPSVGGDPQAFSSVITYLKRYAFCSLLGIAADQDDDGNKASKRAQAATIIDNGPAPRGDRGTPAESESPQPVRPAIDDSFAETVTLQLAKLASRATDIDDVGAALAYWNTHSDVLMRARAKHHPQLADYLLAVLHPILKQHLGDILSSAFCLAVEAEDSAAGEHLGSQDGRQVEACLRRVPDPAPGTQPQTDHGHHRGVRDGSRSWLGSRRPNPPPASPRPLAQAPRMCGDGGHEEVPAANGDHWLVGADGELTGEQFSSLIAFAAAFAREWTHADPDARLALEEHNADALGRCPGTSGRLASSSAWLRRSCRSGRLPRPPLRPRRLAPTRATS